jgi:hypothetical protein
MEADFLRSLHQTRQLEAGSQHSPTAQDSSGRGRRVEGREGEMHGWAAFSRQCR